LIIKLDSIIKLVKICFWCFEKGTLEIYSGVPFDFEMIQFFYFEQYDSIFFEPFSCCFTISFILNPRIKGYLRASGLD